MNFKRHRYAAQNGNPTQFNLTQVWQSSFPALQDRDYINTFIERYRREDGYLELMPNDMIQLIERGRNYC